VAQLVTGEYPQLSAIYAEGDRSAGPPLTEDALTEQFERGLAALLDGLAGRMKIGLRAGGRPAAAARRRHSCQPRQSLTARIDKTEENVVIDRRLSGRDEHAVLLD
jgi:hypothetical protein